MLAWTVAALRAAGCDRIVVVVSPATETAVREACPDVAIAVQPEPRGTGDAVAAALPLVEGQARLLVAGGDTPCLRAETLARLLVEPATAAGGIALLSAGFADPSGYGRVVRGADGRVARIVEHRDADPEVLAIREINAGVYAFDAEFLREALPRLGTDNAQGELYLVDVLETAHARGLPVAAVHTDDPDEIHGINDRAQFATALRILRDRLVANWQVAGVGFEDPASVRIEAEVELEADVEIGAGVELRGRTRIGRGSRIDRGCVLRDCQLGADVHLRPYVVADSAILADGCQAGPFVHLRPGSDLGPSARVGNFVEIKNTRLGRASKANHLSYLGDAEIGENVNIGAGTITCNYDGIHKHRTRIEDGAFIGSDTQLVAPVTVGRGAVVGAGTTVTRNVPDGALAVSRSPQREIEGWAERRREPAGKAEP